MGTDISCTPGQGRRCGSGERAGHLAEKFCCTSAVRQNLDSVSGICRPAPRPTFKRVYIVVVTSRRTPTPSRVNTPHNTLPISFTHGEVETAPAPTGTHFSRMNPSTDAPPRRSPNELGSPSHGSSSTTLAASAPSVLLASGDSRSESLSDDLAMVEAKVIPESVPGPVHVEAVPYSAFSQSTRWRMVVLAGLSAICTTIS